MNSAVVRSNESRGREMREYIFTSPTRCDTWDLLYFVPARRLCYRTSTDSILYSCFACVAGGGFFVWLQILCSFFAFFAADGPVHSFAIPRTTLVKCCGNGIF